MERRFQFTPGNIYHISNRGIDGRVVFDDDRDRDRFQMLLYVANGTEPVNVVRHLADAIDFSEATTYERGTPIVDIGAYCLLADGFHLLIREKEESVLPAGEVGISQFMRKLTTAYAMYYNGRRKRRGPLFEGRFKATPVGEGADLRYRRSFIHLAPLRRMDPEWPEEGIQDLERARDFLDAYPYSSYLDHASMPGTPAGESRKERPESAILNRAPFPEDFTENKTFQDFVEDWITLHDDFGIKVR